MGKHSSSSKDRKKAKKKSKKQKHDDNTTDRKKERMHEPDAATELEAAAPSSVVPQVQVAITVPLATNLGGDDGRNETAPSTPGWSWGQAFDAAAQIRPNEDDLDEDFLRRTATSNGGDGDDNDQRGDGGGLATIAGMINDTSKKSHAGEPSEPIPESTETTTHKSKKDRKKKSKKKRKKKSDDEAIHKDDDNDNGSKRNLKKRRRSSDLSASIDKEDPDPSASAVSALEGRMVPSDPIDPSSELMMVLVDTTLGVVLSGTDRTENGDRIQIGKLVNGEVVLDRSSEGGSNKGKVPYNGTMFIHQRMYRSRCSCLTEGCAIIAQILSHGVSIRSKIVQ